MTWSKLIEDELRKLYAAGEAATFIAMELSLKYKKTFTRNMVAGKIDRLKLNSVKRKYKRRGGKNFIAKKKQGTKEELPVPVVAKTISPNPVSFMELKDDQCRWPIDDKFCGNKVEFGNYCKGHAKESIR